MCVGYEGVRGLPRRAYFLKWKRRVRGQAGGDGQAAIRAGLDFWPLAAIGAFFDFQAITA